jgi:hypothetical protein
MRAMVRSIEYNGIIFALKSLAFGWAYYLIYIGFGISLMFKKEVFRRAFIGFCCYSMFIKLVKMTNPIILIEGLAYSVTYIIILTRPQMKKIFDTK